MVELWDYGRDVILHDPRRVCRPEVVLGRDWRAEHAAFAFLQRRGIAEIAYLHRWRSCLAEPFLQ